MTIRRKLELKTLFALIISLPGILASFFNSSWVSSSVIDIWLFNVTVLFPFMILSMIFISSLSFPIYVKGQLKDDYSILVCTYQVSSIQFLVSLVVATYLGHVDNFMLKILSVDPKLALFLLNKVTVFTIVNSICQNILFLIVSVNKFRVHKK